MYILRADTGASYEVNISPSANVEHLKELLAPLTSLLPADQILLCEGTKLEGRRTIESYGLPSKDKEVFLFNRRILDSSAGPPEEVVLPLVELQLPAFKQPAPTKELEGNPLIFALKTYEHQFLHHLNIAQTILEAVERRINVCKACFNEERIQVRGIDSAIVNLNDHMRQLAQSYSSLMSYANQQRIVNEDLLYTFETDLAKLKDVPVHSALPNPLPAQQQKVITLLDFVPEARLRKWAEECRSEHEQLKSRVIELEGQVKRLQDEVDSENRKPHDVDFRMLTDKLTHATDVSKDVFTRVQMFSKDHENVRARVDDALRQSHHQPMWGLCDGFDDIRKVHEAQINMLCAREMETRDATNVFGKSKTMLTRSVYARLRVVSSFQSRIRDVSNTVVAMGEAVNRLRSAFTQLSIVRNMPQAYHASIQEIVRRRGFGKKVRREVGRIAETVVSLRDKEIPKRDAYHTTYFRYLPKELVTVTGLVDALPTFDISLPAFDSRLPPIDSGSADDDDFTLVPFSDEPPPKMQGFERENALVGQSSGGSRDMKSLNAHNNNNNNSSNNLVYNPALGGGNGGGANGNIGTLLGSPSGVDVVKLQKDLAAAKESTTSYADRIKTLEMKLNTTYTQATNAEESLRQYKEKYETTAKKLEASITSSKPSLSDSRLEALLADMEQLKLKAQQKDGIIESKDDVIAHKDAMVQEKEKLNISYEQRLKAKTAEVAFLQTELEKSKDVMSAMEAEQSFLKAQAAAAESKASTLEQEHKAEIDRLVERLKRSEEYFNNNSNSMSVLMREKEEEKTMLLENLEHKLQVSSIEKKALEGKLTAQQQEAERKLHIAGAEKKALEAKLNTQQEEAERKMQAASAEKQALEGRITALQQEMANVHRNLSEVERERETYSRAKQLLVQEKENILHEKNVLEQEKEKILREKDALVDEIKTMENNKAESGRAQQAVAEKLKAGEEVIQHLQKNLVNFESIKKQLTEDILNRDNKLAALEKWRAEHQEESRVLKQQLTNTESKLNMELTRQKQEKDTLWSSFTAEKNNSTQVEAALRTQLQQMQESEEGLLRQIQECSNKMFEQDHVVSALRMEVENLKLSIAQKETKIQEHEGSVSKLEDALHQSISHSSFLESELQDTLTNSSMASTSFVAKSDYDALAQRYARKEAELQEVTTQLSSYSKKSLDSTKTISTLEKKVQEAEEEKKKTLQQLERQATFYRHIEEEYRKMKSSIVDISDTLRRFEINPLPVNDKDQENVAKLQARVEKVLSRFAETKEEAAACYAKNIEMETQLANMRKVQDSLEQALFIRAQEKEDSDNIITEQKDRMTALELCLADRPPDPKISLNKFADGKLALFRRNSQGFYEALNVGSPNYYLSEYAIEQLEDKSKPQPFIYGEIVELDKGNADAIHNPYKLPLGTEYHEVTITQF